MQTKSIHPFNFCLPICILLLFSYCTHRNSASQQENSSTLTDTIKKIKEKPPGTYNDTILIKNPSIVFFYPDSLQLEKIKKQSDSLLFSSMLHENDYQMNYARTVVEKTWPQLNIITVKNYRYLNFLKKDSSGIIIDLNKLNHAFGLYVFDGKKAPILTDMTNIDSEISFYLAEK